MSQTSRTSCRTFLAGAACKPHCLASLERPGPARQAGRPDVPLSPFTRLFSAILEQATKADEANALGGKGAGFDVGRP